MNRLGLLILYVCVLFGAVVFSGCTTVNIVPPSENEHFQYARPNKAFTISNLTDVIVTANLKSTFEIIGTVEYENRHYYVARYNINPAVSLLIDSNGDYRNIMVGNMIPSFEHKTKPEDVSFHFD